MCACVPVPMVFKGYEYIYIHTHTGAYIKSPHAGYLLPPPPTLLARRRDGSPPSGGPPSRIVLASGVGGDLRARFKLLPLPPSSLEDGDDGSRTKTLSSPPKRCLRGCFVLSCTRTCTIINCDRLLNYIY